jgi:hypothetical protein
VSGAEHVPNIGDRGARRRRRSGVAWTIVTIGVLAALYAGGASRWTRLVIAIPAGMAAIGFLQARERT